MVRCFRICNLNFNLRCSIVSSSPDLLASAAERQFGVHGLSSLCFLLPHSIFLPLVTDTLLSNSPQDDSSFLEPLMPVPIPAIDVRFERSSRANERFIVLPVLLLTLILVACIR